MIAQDFTTPVASTGLLQFAPAVPADPEVGLVVILVKPEAAVVLRQVVAETKIMAAPRARERDLLEYFSAQMAPAHHESIVGRERNRLRPGRGSAGTSREIRGCRFRYERVGVAPDRNGF